MEKIIFDLIKVNSNIVMSSISFSCFIQVNSMNVQGKCKPIPISLWDPVISTLAIRHDKIR